jgi:hypothetical protein
LSYSFSKQLNLATLAPSKSISCPFSFLPDDYIIGVRFYSPPGSELGNAGAFPVSFALELGLVGAVGVGNAS